MHVVRVWNSADGSNCPAEPHDGNPWWRGLMFWMRWWNVISVSSACQERCWSLTPDAMRVSGPLRPLARNNRLPASPRKNNPRRSIRGRYYTLLVKRSHFSPSSSHLPWPGYSDPPDLGSLMFTSHVYHRWAGIRKHLVLFFIYRTGKRDRTNWTALLWGMIKPEYRSFRRPNVG